MRENMGVYRGKTKDGEWVEGNLVHADDIIPPKTGTLMNMKHFSPTCNKMGIQQGRIAVYVLPETVGEWTGLTDKNGKRIFEGDIINYDRLIGDVRYGKYLQSKCHEYACEHCGFYIAHEVYDGYCHDTGHSLKDEEQPYMEVIGNIHDNPELVKE